MNALVTEPQTLATTSAFEVIGPIMVGPSSSHTAGALRCARVATSLLGEKPAKVHFILWNSFAHTYKGHGTDRALVAGALGLDTDDERIRDAFELAADAGLAVSFGKAGDDPSLHPNTVDIQLTGVGGLTCEVRGESLGGGRMRISRINGVGVDLSGTYATLFVAHDDKPGVLAQLTGLLGSRGCNIAFCRTYRTEQGGAAYTVLETDGAADNDLVPAARALPHVRSATMVQVPGSAAALAPGVSARDLFDNGAQLLAACTQHFCSIGELMREREAMLCPDANIDAAMARVLEVMHAETEEPLKEPRRSLGGFLGGEAQAVSQASSQWAASLMGTVQTDAVARAMAVLERSAAMGVIVAAPTAGSSGVVPGCVLAAGAAFDASDEQLKRALWCAAAVGLLIQSAACVAGAEGGCQAEVGSSAAMAAAALVELLGGTPEQALTASSLALANLLGLVCDPVGGLVEVPCQARNAIGVAAAFSGAQLALSGITSLVPFDEVVRVMSEVGHAMPASLRETAQGGLAQTPSALSACARCRVCR